MSFSSSFAPWSRRVAAIALVGLLLPAAGAAAEAPTWHPATHRCQEVTFTGDVGTCSKSQCLLTGHTQLRCNDLLMWADSLQVDWTDTQQFAGAKATGHVLLVDGNAVINCTHAELGPDRVQGRISQATIHLKSTHAHRDARGVPTGRSAAIFHGNIDRESKDHLTIHHADYTLCDCKDAPPSWRLNSPEIDAVLGKRATIWWPTVTINPFNLGLVTVTPPLPPLSVPLEARAWGFLAPHLAFYNGLPMIDLPFFMPLGKHWDITVAPGLRTDWGTHTWSPATWGAPRLGGRLRFAPLPGLQSEIDAQWTHDGQLGAARALQQSAYAKVAAANHLTTARVTTLCKDRPPASSLSPAEQSALAQCDAVATSLAPRRALRDRISINWKQRWQLQRHLRWMVQASWLSDDLIPQDFGLTLQDQVKRYIPSRTELTWRSDNLWGALGADYLVRIGNNSRDYSNLRGAERRTGQRGPAAELQLLPTRVLGPVHVNASASFVRYGPWASGLPATQMIGGGDVGLSYLDHIGPVRTAASADADLLWVGEGRHSLAFSTVRFGADADMVLARRYGRFVHTITPRLSYRGMPLSHGTAGQAQSVQDTTLDERLDVVPFEQVMASLVQDLWLQRKGTVASRLQLELDQPWDLVGGTILPSRARLSWQLPRVSTGEFWVSVDPRRALEPMQEIGARLGVPVGPVALSAQYARWSPRAERFHRSIYELSGNVPAGVLDTSQWVHSLTATATLNWHGASLGYTAEVLLLRPGEHPTGASPTDRPFVTQHIVRASYESACQCWGVRAQAVVSGADPTAVPRLSFLLTIGQIKLGG